MPRFLDLSLELNQMIAHQIVDDGDLQNYRLGCRFANDATDGDGGTFWRKRFIAHYDSPLTPLSNLQYKKKYIQRQCRLGLHGTSGDNKSGFERKSLEVIRELMVGMT